MRYLVIIVLAWFASATPVIGQAQSDKCLTLVYDGKIGPSQPYFERFYRALYARVGLCQTPLKVTSNRKEQLLKTGSVDGDWIRVEGFAEQYPDSMIALPQPIFEMPARFFWLVDTAFDGTPNGLMGLRIGHPQGYRWLEWNLPKHDAMVIPLEHENTVWELLTRNRLDVYATGNMSAQMLMEQAEDMGLQYQTAVWKYVPFHHLLHKRHAGLVTRLNEALIEMTASGDLQTLLKVPGIRLAEIRNP